MFKSSGKAKALCLKMKSRNNVLIKTLLPSYNSKRSFYGHLRGLSGVCHCVSGSGEKTSGPTRILPWELRQGAFSWHLLLYFCCSTCSGAIVGFIPWIVDRTPSPRRDRKYIHNLEREGELQRYKREPVDQEAYQGGPSDIHTDAVTNAISK